MATATRTPVAPKNDMYTVLLIISLAAMVLGCMLLLLDYMDYGTATPPDVPKASTIKPPVPAAPGGAAAGGFGAPVFGGPSTAPAGQPAPAPTPTTQPGGAPPPAPAVPAQPAPTKAP